MSRTLESIVQMICDDIYIKTSDAVIPVIKRYVNRAYKALARRENIEKKVTVSAVDGLITKPSDYVKVIELRYNSVPLTYEEENGKIKSAYSGDLELVYNYEPTDLVNNADVPVTDAANDEFIYDYVKYLWYSRENKKEYKAEIHKRNYETMSIKKVKKQYQFTVER